MILCRARSSQRKAILEQLLQPGKGMLILRDVAGGAHILIIQHHKQGVLPTGV